MSNQYTTAGSLHDPLSERQKMLSGKPYLAMSDGQLVKERLRARHLLQRYNNHPWPIHEEEDPEPDYFGPDERRSLLAELFGIQLDDVKNLPIEIEPPLYCDYGNNITFKGPFYSNFNCHILDCATVTFGSRVILGPGVHIYAGTHSTDVGERKQGLERAYPVNVGDDVWIGGNAVILGPCTIGHGTTIAAGAVVRGNVPANVLMGGVPARILKRLDPTKSQGTRPPKVTKPVVEQQRDPSVAMSHATDEEVADPATQLFIANIPARLRPVDLKAALRKHGELVRVTLDRSRHLGFVQFATPEGAEAAVQAGRAPSGFIVPVEEGKDILIGIERRRSPEEQRAFNPELITNPRCWIRSTLLSPAQLEELKQKLENDFGTLKTWTVIRRDTAGAPEEKTEVELEFENVGGARSAIRASRAPEDGLGLVLGSGGRVRVESRKFIPFRFGRGGFARGGFSRGGFVPRGRGRGTYFRKRGGSNVPGAE